MKKFVGPALMLLAAGAIVAAERRWPLRIRTAPSARRTMSNLLRGAGCAAVIGAVEDPLCRRIAARNAAHGRGLAYRLPRSFRLIAGVASMDYGFYLWHVATHKVPLLWHWHRVHHADPDLDASTALRFVPVDMLVSLPWRLVQVRLAGADLLALTVWRRFFTLSILFHHANIRLPGAGDRRLAWLLTTPKMHGIHHGEVAAEHESNWSSGLSLWDRIHGTLRQDVVQEKIVIGLPAEPEACKQPGGVPQD